ncbi:GAF domain-containing protein [Actinacidiphila acididurans]|uniref:GAF domain-containing protein n=1 Tax=Actinacidiphila acididurans TaxID=2784346 RepID=A0ABS2TIS2_9ACTN|nr:GAF domain-containing protein [Actinacidiphila acididurans]MBM9503244.1 GAF domain-containing protein [Actinacidiphila acididurans]
MTYRPETMQARLEVLRRPDAGPAALVGLVGEVGDGDSAVLDSYLGAAAGAYTAEIVVDLAGVTYLSEPAVRILDRFARLRAAEGRRVHMTGASPRVTALLGPVAAGATWSGPSPVPAGAPKNGAASGPRPYPPCDVSLIRRAQRTLVARYGLDGPLSALELLRSAARRYTVTLGPLAAAVVGTPPPAPGAAHWFAPAPTRVPAPALPCAPSPGPGETLTRAEAVAAIRDAACALMDSELGNVQVATPGGVLLLEEARGFSAQFTDHFRLVRDDTSACGRALLDGMRVIVPEVATHPVYDEDARRVMLTDGVRSVQSTPLTAPSGRRVGMVSTHYPQPRRVHTTAELGALDRLAAEAAAWLEWHHETVVRAALEDVHRQALLRPGADEQVPA